MQAIDAPEYAAREDASFERPAVRRSDRTGWLPFGGDSLFFRAIVGPGCDVDGLGAAGRRHELWAPECPDPFVACWWDGVLIGGTE